ncbi:MAG: hypothetical protein PHY08_14430 [Candidatus Cloacimonetes bacterium]|nr:hypothetical protein [Candidatus Cloacimonadota bacterium]
MGLRRSFKPANIVVNSDFSNGITDWNPVAASVLVANNEATVLATAQYGSISSKVFNVVGSHKYYYRVYLKTGQPFITLRFYDGTALTANTHSGSGNYELLSGIRTAASDKSTGFIRVQDSNASGWADVYVKEFMGIDLTIVLPADILALSDANLKTWCNHNLPCWFDGRLSGGSFGGIGGGLR